MFLSVLFLTVVLFYCGKKYQNLAVFKYMYANRSWLMLINTFLLVFIVKHQGGSLQIILPFILLFFFLSLYYLYKECT